MQSYKPRDLKRENQMINDATFYDYYKRLRALALAEFEWKNLPPSMNARFLEKVLYDYGKSIIINDPTLGILNMKCTTAGGLNHYEEPVNYNAYSVSYQQTRVSAENCAIVRNNTDMSATDETIILFAQRLYELEMAWNVNIKNQKTPALVKGSDKQILSLKNAYRDYDGNTPVMFVDKSFDENLFKTFPTLAPFVADKLMLQKHQVWAEALTFLGLDNANTDKKERLITDEVESNNEQIEMAAQVMLMTRLEACEAMKKLWPKECANVSVKIRSFEERQPQQSQKKEGETIG